MLHLSSYALWKEIRSLVKPAKRRRAAVAYATKDLVGFKKGDVLVVDASKEAIAAGETSAKLLKQLYRRKVIIHSWPRLHAKVIVTEDVAIVGSANMSASSESRLQEASLITDSPQAVSQAAAFVEQLAAASAPLNKEQLDALARIKVKRRGRFPLGGTAESAPKILLGKNTWLVSVYEMDDTPDVEKKFADQKTEEVAAEHDISSDEVSWIRKSSGSKFAKEAQPGDTVIQIWRERRSDKKPACVLKPVPIFAVESLRKTTFVFSPHASGKRAELPWSKFKKLLAELGDRRAGINSERTLRGEVAEAIGMRWHKV